MKLLSIVFTALLILTTFASAQDARVVIDAPSKVAIGELVKIDLSQSQGGGFDFIITPTPPGLAVFDGGKTIVCGTGPKPTVYTVIVSCALEGNSDVALLTIEVSDKVIEPDKSLMPKIKSWASVVMSPNRREEAMTLAQSFASVGIIAEQGGFENVDAMLEATAISNRDALGKSLQYWVPFLDSLMRELEIIADNGGLNTIDEHAQVWKSVAEGLRVFAEGL